MRAAQSLGASFRRAACIVIRDSALDLPRVLSAGLLVFIVSTGFFIAPTILGSPGDMMVANLVDFYAHKIVDFGSASALAMLDSNDRECLHFGDRLSARSARGAIWGPLNG